MGPITPQENVWIAIEPIHSSPRDWTQHYWQEVRVEQGYFSEVRRSGALGSILTAPPSPSRWCPSGICYEPLLTASATSAFGYISPHKFVMSNHSESSKSASFQLKMKMNNQRRDVSAVLPRKADKSEFSTHHIPQTITKTDCLELIEGPDRV